MGIILQMIHMKYGALFFQDIEERDHRNCCLLQSYSPSIYLLPASGPTTWFGWGISFCSTGTGSRWDSKICDKSVKQNKNKKWMN